MFRPLRLAKPFLYLSLFASCIMLIGCGPCNVKSTGVGVSRVEQLGTLSNGGKSLTILWKSIDGELLRTLRDCHSLTELRIIGADPHGLPLIQHISELTQLEKLSLIEVPVSDDELQLLAKLKNLKRLELVETGIDGSGLELLAKLPITDLNLRESAVTADGMATLEYFKDLENLELMLPTFHLSQLPSLASLSKLQRLQILGGFYSFREFGGLHCLVGAESIRELMIAGKNINDRSMRAISELKNLERLEVGDSHVSYRGIQYLVGLAQLQSLKVRSVEGTPLQSVVGASQPSVEEMPTRG